MNRWRAIVFDLDDTLYPEQEYVLSGFQAVADWAEIHLGVPAEEGFDALRQLHESGIRGNTFNRWLDSLGNYRTALVPRMVQVYQEHRPRLKPYPGVPELLADLGRNYRLGLASDGYLISQQQKLIALNLTTYFDAVVFSDEWGRQAWKPSPKPFTEALKQLDVPAASAIYVGDNPTKDFIGARKVGMATVRVRHLDGQYTHLDPSSDEHAAHYEIRSVMDLADALTRLESVSE